MTWLGRSDALVRITSVDGCLLRTGLTTVLMEDTGALGVTARVDVVPMIVVPMIVERMPKASDKPIEGRQNDGRRVQTKLVHVEYVQRGESGGKGEQSAARPLPFRNHSLFPLGKKMAIA